MVSMHVRAAAVGLFALRPFLDFTYSFINRGIARILSYFRQRVVIGFCGD